MARSGNYISGRDKRADEVKTALGAIRRDLDAVVAPRLITFNCDTTTGGTPEFMWPWQAATLASVATELFIYVPTACIAKNMLLAWRTAGTGTGSMTATVRRNLADTSLLATKSPVGAAAAGPVFNRSNVVQYEAGDKLGIKLTTAGTFTASPTDIWVSLELY